MISIFTAVATHDCATTSFLLRECGNHVDEVDDLGRTCLHIASSLGYFQIVQILLSFGANPNIQDRESGWTALHRAVYFNHLKIALLLINAGAILENKDDVSPITYVVRDKNGMTPMDLITYKLCSGLVISSPLSSPTIDMPKHVECGIPTPKFNHFGALYAFGKADITLGIALPKTIDIVRPRRVETMMDISSHSICTGKYHCLATSENGEVYSWGHNRGGKLGHCSEESLFPVPTLINFFVTSQQKIVRIALSDNHSMALSNSGALFSWGSNRFGQLGHSDIDTTKQISCPRRLEFFKRDIVLGMASGEAHCICFTENGDVYTWGSNKHGQLGLKIGEVGTTPNGPGNMVPKKISFPIQLHSRHSLVTRNENIAYVVDVVAAYQSSLILIKQRSPSSNSQGAFFFHKYQQRFPNGFASEVYQWGDGVPQPRKVHFSHNMRSQNASTSVKAGNNTLGKFDDKYLHNFSDYYWSDHSQIIQLCAGKHHFAALTLNNIVFTWGLHADSLGHAGSVAHPITSLQQSSPQIVHALLPENLSPGNNSSSKSSCFGSKIITLAAAGDRTAAVTEAGDVYTWGVSAQKGVLSPDTAQTCQFLPKRMSGVKCVKAIALAEDYTMIIVDLSMPMQNVDVISTQCNPQGQNNMVKNSSEKHLLNRILSIGQNNDSEEDSDSEENETTSYSGNNDKESIAESARGGSLTNNFVSPRSLQEICQLVACNGVTFKNVFSALQFAETYYAELLQEHCLYFIYRNLIALLTYMKPSEIERVVSDWKLPQSSSNQKNGGIGGNVPSSTPLSPSLSQRKSMGVITQNKAPNTIASTPNSPITPKVEYSNVINYSDPKVIASAMKTKEIELQAISTVSELQKCMRSVKKRISAIQELQDKVSQENYLLSVEQNEKVQRKALLQAEYALMEQFLVRLSVREKQSHNIGRDLSEDQSTKNSSAIAEVACNRDQTARNAMLCNTEEAQILTPERNTEPVVSQKSNKGKSKWKKFDPLAEVAASSMVTISSATGSGRTVLSPPVTAATAAAGAQSITKRSWNIAPIQQPGVANENTAEKTVKSADAPVTSAGNRSVSSGPVTAVNLHPATLKKPSSSGNNTPVPTTSNQMNDFGLAFDFDKALEAKRQQKKSNSNKNIPESSVDNSKLPQPNVPKPAWGGASMKPKEAPTAGGATSLSSPSVMPKPAQSLADILAEEEAMRIQKRFHPSYVPPSPALAGISSGHSPRLHNPNHAAKPANNPWYIANKTLALPLHQVIEQQSEEQEFEQQLKRIQEMENLEKMQRSSGKPKNSGKQKQKNIK